MKNGKIIFSLLMIFFFNEISSARPAGKTIRVLFIGNSYTYYNSMPQLFKTMAESKFPGKQIEAEFTGGGGATLKLHWETGHALKQIESGKWDFVVLQEQSMLGSEVVEKGESYFGSPDQFFSYARLFDRAIRQNGAETVFFMTWSRKDYKHQQKYLTYAYMTIAEELNSRIAPAGMIWDRIRDNESIELYQKDGAHPSVLGSFLAAATLFSVIFDTPPTGIPGQLEGYEILRGGELAKQKSLLSDLTESEANILLKTAAAVLDQLKGNGGYPEVEEAIIEKEPSVLAPVFQHLRTAEGQFFTLMGMCILFLILKGCYKKFSRKI